MSDVLSIYMQPQQQQVQDCRYRIHTVRRVYTLHVAVGSPNARPPAVAAGQFIDEKSVVTLSQSYLTRIVRDYVKARV